MRIFLYLCLLSATLTQAADRYLDAAASGANDGTSWTDAWTDMTNINWSAVSSGDTLWIQGGSYSQFKIVGETGLTVKIATNATEQAVFANATAASELYDVDYLLIDGLLNGQPMIKIIGTPSALPYSSVEGFTFRLRLCQTNTLRGLEITREDYYNDDEARAHGILIANSSTPRCDQIIIENCYIHRLTADGINISSGASGAYVGFDRFVVRSNIITHVMDDGIQSGAAFSSYYDNYVDNADTDAKFGGHQDGIQTAINCNDLKIYNNVFRGFGQNIFVEYADGNVYIYNNILVGLDTSGSERGMTISAQTNFTGVWVQANNTFYSFLSYTAINGGFSVKTRVPPEGWFVGNQIFVNCKNLQFNSTNGVLDSSNIYWDMPGVQYYNTDGTPASVPVARGAYDSVFADPLLANPVLTNITAADFSLLTNSPAIGAGQDLSAHFTTDFSGVARSAPWSLGAVETPTESGGEPSPEGPSITTTIGPRWSPIARSVRLVGTNFLNTTNVLIDGVAADYTVQSDTVMLATVPAQRAVGTGTVVVANELGSTTNTFTVAPPASGFVSP